MPPLLIVIFVILVVIIGEIFHISFENAVYATVVLICVIFGAIMGVQSMKYLNNKNVVGFLK